MCNCYNRDSVCNSRVESMGVSRTDRPSDILWGTHCLFREKSKKVGNADSPVWNMQTPRACATAHASISQFCSRFPCVSPQIGGQLFDLCSIISPSPDYFKGISEKVCAFSLHHMEPVVVLLHPHFSA